MHNKLVKSGDAEKLSAGVAKDAINRYNVKKKIWQCPFLIYV